MQYPWATPLSSCVNFRRQSPHSKIAFGGAQSALAGCPLAFVLGSCDDDPPPCCTLLCDSCLLGMALGLGSVCSSLGGFVVVTWPLVVLRRYRGIWRRSRSGSPLEEALCVRSVGNTIFLLGLVSVEVGFGPSWFRHPKVVLGPLPFRLRVRLRAGRPCRLVRPVSALASIHYLLFVRGPSKASLVLCVPRVLGAMGASPLAVVRGIETPNWLRTYTLRRSMRPGSIL